MLRKIILLTALALVIAIGASSAKPVDAATHVPLNDTWNTYSLMFSRSAGQFYAGNQVGGQWAWQPQSNTVSDISWGKPDSWPPDYAERFVRSSDGNWVLIEGYSDGQGQPITQEQRVISERIGDAQCQNMRPLLLDDNRRQHYAKWYIPKEGYCLDAFGTIKSPTNGTTVHFRHRQKWSPPTQCSNEFIHNQKCIIQQEEWWDDNGHPYGIQLDRTQYIARNIGMAFKIVQTYPSAWSAGGRYYWNW